MPNGKPDSPVAFAACCSPGLLLRTLSRCILPIVKMPRNGIALCALGLERVCAAELKRIGLPETGREAGRVRFDLGEDPAVSLERANLWLRTAERVLIEAGTFPARDFDELFESARAIPWELYFKSDGAPVIERVRIKDSKLSAQTAVQSIAHKAIYERLGRAYKVQRLPETGFSAGIRIYLDKDICTVGVDSSGDALHKRGYRRATGPAPLKETVAAGALLLAGWTRRQAFLDPFCGSGTLAIEAALFALDMAPGLGRRFLLESMPFASGSGPGSEREKARAAVRMDVDLRIRASDADPDAIAAAKVNARLAGVGDLLEFSSGQAEDAEPFASSGSLICNPPYGERLGTPAEAEELYRRLGALYRRFDGWGLGFVTNRQDFGHFFGRRATTEKRIVNGAEEQWFHWYPAQRK